MRGFVRLKGVGNLEIKRLGDVTRTVPYTPYRYVTAYNIFKGAFSNCQIQLLLRTQLSTTSRHWARF